jgi:DNA polymerase-4
LRRPRTIIHLDLDAFYCAVEENRDKSLRGRAFAVGGRPEQRGVVASCSYAARLSGIRSAMPMARAVKLCPDLAVIPPRFRAYHQASERVMERMRALTPLVEQISIDEAFLDVSHVPDSGDATARRLQHSVRTELSLPCSLGVATCKLVAKIATEVGKSTATAGRPPNAVVVVPPGEEASFLAPLPVRMLWGVGPKTAERLGRLGVITIGDIARLSDRQLTSRFGQIGYDLAQRARGIDDRPVVTEHEVKSISQEVTFPHDVRDGDQLRSTLRELAEGVGRQLRKAGHVGRTVKLKLRWSDFTTLTRQLTLPQATDRDDVIGDSAVHLFDATWQPTRPVRLLGVGVSSLSGSRQQLLLWEDVPQRSDALQQTLDGVRDRFGPQAVRRAGSTGPDDAPHRDTE